MVMSLSQNHGLGDLLKICKSHFFEDLHQVLKNQLCHTLQQITSVRNYDVEMNTVIVICGN